MSSRNTESIPLPAIRRFPGYLMVLEAWEKRNEEWISATDIGRELDHKSIVVRKDLAFTEVVGHSRKGYRVSELGAALRQALGWDNPAEALLVGLGSLGRALMGYDGFGRYGLRIVAGFDPDPAARRNAPDPERAFPMEKLADLAGRMKVTMGVIAVPEDMAQETADLLVQAGIRGIWNFAPVNLKVPDGVIVRREDLSLGLAVLSYRLNRNG